MLRIIQVKFRQSTFCQKIVRNNAFGPHNCTSKLAQLIF